MPRRQAGKEVIARCHCGAVTLRLERRPKLIAHCNCSLCQANGWRGAYYRSDQVQVLGALHDYVRGDMREPKLRLFRCANCGTATHWHPLSEPPHARIGINANLLSADSVEGVQVLAVDGSKWPT